MSAQHDFVVLPRAVLFEFFGRMALPPWRDERGKWIGGNIDCAPIATEIEAWVEANEHRPDLCGCEAESMCCCPCQVCQSPERSDGRQLPDGDGPSSKLGVV